MDIESTNRELVEHIEGLVDGQPNRAALLALVRMATDSERAKVLFEQLQEQSFLDPAREDDPDERPDRWAWDLTLHATESYAVLAVQQEGSADAA